MPELLLYSSVMNKLHGLLSIAFLCVLLSGCTYLQLFPQKDADSFATQKEPLLKPIEMPTDAVGVEIFFVRRSVGNQDSAQGIWNNVTEMSFSEQTRRQLRLNGFRFGLLASGQVSHLLDLLKIADPQSGAKIDAWDEMIKFAKDENVMGRYVELLPGQPTEALASDIYNELTVLQNTGDGIGGESYSQAQCVFRITSTPRPDGAIDLTILPEIQYGQSKQQYLYEQGMVKLEYGRCKKTFDQLQLKTKLRPGEMVVLSCLPDQKASLGANFFSDATIRGDYQKLMILRLVRWRQDPLFPENGVKQTDCVNEPIRNVKSPEQIQPVILSAPESPALSESSEKTENSDDSTDNPPKAYELNDSDLAESEEKERVSVDDSF